MITRKVKFTRRTQGSGGRTDGDYTEGIVSYYYGRNLLLQSHFTSCEIVFYCEICGTYGTRDRYSCNCHDYPEDASFWYSFRDLLRALSGEAEEIPGDWTSMKKREARDRFNKEIKNINQVYAIMATLDLLQATSSGL